MNNYFLRDLVTVSLTPTPPSWLVAQSGLEPEASAYEADMLPLHYRASYGRFFLRREEITYKPLAQAGSLLRFSLMESKPFSLRWLRHL